MKKIIPGLITFLSIFSIQLPAQEILLPDQVFTIKVIEKNVDGRTENMPPDELILKANQITSTFSAKNGFSAVPYSVTQQAAPNSFMLDFKAESINDNKETLKWSGTINGNSVKGKAQRIRNGSPAGEYIFSGTLKKKK